MTSWRSPKCCKLMACSLQQCESWSVLNVTDVPSAALFKADHHVPEQREGGMLPHDKILRR